MTSPSSFATFGFKAPLLAAIAELGYETPSPVQNESIPVLLSGQDLIAQAQTGTGKTAAFALPILQQLQLKKTTPQALVLAPTRELAIQVAEAFQRYAKQLKGFHVLPIYGGQDYKQQLRMLKRGVHVVVGTPGRVMDHMRRGTLQLDAIQHLVLDEADEMLRMGFIDDVKWILEQLPHQHQKALFSATMPASIREVAKAHLHNPQQVKVKSTTMTATGIVQSAMLVSQKHKMEALTRYLEMTTFDAVIIFARTKTMASTLAERLAARGYLVCALHGDMNQNAREKVIQRLKRGSLDIVVATDVAARGLDVERISHVINYDAPYDAEIYVHRIGRTGRAGREGQSLLMITPREAYHLGNIERKTKQKITMITPPTLKALNATRLAQFTAGLQSILSDNHLDYYRELVEKIVHDSERSELDVAAALLKLAQKGQPLNCEAQDTPLLDAEEAKAGQRKSSSRRGRRSKSGQKTGRGQHAQEGKRQPSRKKAKTTQRSGKDKKAGGAKKRGRQSASAGKGSSKPGKRRTKKR